MTICSMPECTNPAESRGWCTKHYKRWRSHGDPTVVMKRGRKPTMSPICKAEDCEGETVAFGLCWKHYKRWDRDGRPMVPLLRKAER